MDNPDDQSGHPARYMAPYGPHHLTQCEAQCRPMTEISQNNQNTLLAIPLPQGSQVKAHSSKAEKKLERYRLRTQAHKDALLVNQFSQLKVAKEPRLSRREKRREMSWNRLAAWRAARRDTLLSAQLAELHLQGNNTNTLRDSTAAAGTAGATEAILTAERALALLQNAGQAEKDAKQGSQQATMRRLIPSVEDKVTGVGETLRAWEGASKS